MGRYCDLLEHTAKQREVERNGLWYAEHSDVQMWLCGSCGYRFSDSKVKVDILKEGLVLPETVHNFRDLDAVDLGTSEVGFKNPTLPIGEDVGSHAFSTVGKP